MSNQQTQQKTQQRQKKRLNPFTVAYHAHENIDWNIDGIQKSKPGSLEHKKHLSWLAKTSNDLVMASRKTEKLAAQLVAAMTYLNYRTRNIPDAQNAVNDPKNTIKQYFDDQQQHLVDSYDPKNDEQYDDEPEDEEEHVEPEQST